MSKHPTTHDTGHQTSPHLEFLKRYLQNASKHELAELFLKNLKENHYFSDKQIQALLEKAKDDTQALLPLSIFHNDKLSALEIIVKYLKEEKHYRFSAIAKTLHRDQRTIWVTYNKAKKKQEKPLAITPSDTFIPASLFADRTLSVLENLVTYLKEEKGMRYSQIAKTLKKNDRTVWTVHHRAKKKRGER